MRNSAENLCRDLNVSLEPDMLEMSLSHRFYLRLEVNTAILFVLLLWPSIHCFGKLSTRV